MNSDEAALDQAEQLGEGFEGFSSVPYRCPAGIWTFGFGSTRDSDSNPVCATTRPIDRAEGKLLAERDLRGALSEIHDDVHVPLTTEEEAALLDFIYNIGAGNFRASTLLRKLNAGDFEGCADEIPRWDMAGGRVLAGLVRRRGVERAAFLAARACQAQDAVLPAEAEPVIAAE
jgi:lysozyme